MIRQLDADRYESLATIPTVKRARTSIFNPEDGCLYLAVPRLRSGRTRKTRRSGSIRPGRESASVYGSRWHEEDSSMKWVTRENAKVDRIACPWLIRRFVDPDAEFLFVPTSEVMEVAEREGAIPFDVTGVELGHVDGRCSFESIMLKYDLMVIPRSSSLPRSSTPRTSPPTSIRQPRGEGSRRSPMVLPALRHDDARKIELESPLYDALYAWCREAGPGSRRIVLTQRSGGT